MNAEQFAAADRAALTVLRVFFAQQAARLLSIAFGGSRLDRQFATACQLPPDKVLGLLRRVL
jgi:hypothetical protein